MFLKSFPECLHAFGSFAGATQSVVPVVAGQRVNGYAAIITVSASTSNVSIADSGGTNLSQAFQATGITVDRQQNGDPWWTTGIGLGLQLKQSGSATVGYDIYYLQGP